ncbi:MAG: response regulator [Methylococcaceae bacterium]
MINVLIVDDHELMRLGIAGILEDDPAIVIQGCASSGEEAVKKVEYLNPDVVLLDVNMPGMGGVETLKCLCAVSPSLFVIILTVHADGGLPTQLMNLGARGYLSKNCGQDELLEAIHKVAKGECYVGQEVRENLSKHNDSDWVSASFGKLSVREMQIILLILQGKDIEAIAETLDIGIKTINTYRRRAYEKLGVRNDVELVLSAGRHGLQTA